MSANPGTEIPEQVNDPINKFEIRRVHQPRQSGCPIAREITHRLQIPPVIGDWDAVDVGGVRLLRDDFCPESAYCALCSFVAKVRPGGTNSASRRSVHFVLDKSTNNRLRRWMDKQLISEAPPLDNHQTTNVMIVVTSGANVFQKLDLDMEKPYCYCQKHEPESCILGTLHFWKYQEPSSNLLTPKLDTLTYIAKQAKEWLRFCDECDEVCRSLVSNSTPPISLIDCNRHCLEHGSQGIRYVALSYVWGKTGRNFNLPERKYGIPLDGLPRTISDAIKVTKSLGYDYLWVDMLCIDQQSKEDKHRQIAIMDKIYRSADLTIIVAAGNDCGDGIPGVSERCRPPRLSTTIGNTILVEEKEDPGKEIETSIWRSRGWTFQEGLLSRRRLVFTDSQILFSCFSGQTIEPRGGPEFPQTAEDPVTLLAPRDVRRKARFWDTRFLKTDSHDPTTLTGTADLYYYGFPLAFAELLEKYSTLCFSFESDIVDAFRAIGNVFASRTPPVLHLYGLPFISGDESTTASSLTRGLTWYLERGNEETARRPGFPSWSWLGYRGPVRWGGMPWGEPILPIDRKWSAKPFSHVRSMITINNRRYELLQLSQWWQEWSRAKASEGLAPSRLMILGTMIRQEVWLGAGMPERVYDVSPNYISAKVEWFPEFQYNVGIYRRMSVDACQCLLENLRQATWRALLLTQSFLLVIQSTAANGKGGPYRRVASADVDISRTKEGRLEWEDFVKEFTELVNIELV